ncbi:type II toxin-antitoxin system RelE family toxin [Sinomonas sp. P47F7]|uniref:type II toxin-antitoxin system RelE family toxin n=1 Tax=Sinomonas sp. P47F7 TaxID=3410987 RepID=UPI003BF60204
MTTDEDSYELVMTPPAVKSVRSRLPESVAAAVIEFVTGALIANPRRVGKPLREPLAGIHAARRGTYRVLYRINDARREVVVLSVEHRRDAYRNR